MICESWFLTVVAVNRDKGSNYISSAQFGGKWLINSIFKRSFKNHSPK
jgi:hypothetical protein